MDHKWILQRYLECSRLVESMLINFNIWPRVVCSFIFLLSKWHIYYSIYICLVFHDWREQVNLCIKLKIYILHIFQFYNQCHTHRYSFMELWKLLIRHSIIKISPHVKKSTINKCIYLFFISHKIFYPFYN